MNGRRFTIGLCALCALGLTAIAAPGASAATKGTTAFTCRSSAVEGAGFSREHCASADAVETGAKYEHVALGESGSTVIKASNEKTSSETTASTPLALKVTTAGSPTEFLATTVEGEGLLENSKDASGEHYIHGTVALTFSGVTITKPEGKGCKVYADNSKEMGSEGVISTTALKATTTEQGDFVKFEPASGTVFATFFVECSKEVPESMKGTFEVKGTLKGVPDGATVNFAHTEGTTQNTLTIKGSKAALNGSLTISGVGPTTAGLGLTTSEGTKGTTAFACEGVATEAAGFSKSHCKTGDAVEAGAAYLRAALAPSTSNQVTATNEGTGAGTSETTPFKLKTTLAGIPIGIEATGVHGEGLAENKVDASGEHYSRGTGSLVFTGAIVTLTGGKGCKVYEDAGGVKGAEGRVPTESLEATTTEQGDFVKLSPAKGEVLAKFILEGCTFAGFNGVYEVKGSVKGVPNGATLNFTHEETTTQGTLVTKGTKTGLEGSVALSVSTPPLTPLSVTTVETP